jgi:hypothetical protein
MPWAMPFGSLPVIVRADHEHDQLGIEPIEIAVLHAPEDLRHLVAADGVVEDLDVGVALLSSRSLAVALPEVGDRVAVEDEVVRALLELVEIAGWKRSKPVGGRDREKCADGRARGRAHRERASSRPAASVLVICGPDGSAGRPAVGVACASGQYLIDDGLDGVGPDVVALGRGMQEVGHDVGGERAVGLEELVADVEVGHMRAVIVAWR